MAAPVMNMRARAPARTWATVIGYPASTWGLVLSSIAGLAALRTAFEYPLLSHSFPFFLSCFPLFLEVLDAC